MKAPAATKADPWAHLPRWCDSCAAEHQQGATCPKQAQGDLDCWIVHSGGNDLGRAIQKQIREFVDLECGFEDTIARLTRAALLHGRAYTNHNFLDDPEKVEDWVRTETERYWRKQGWETKSVLDQPASALSVVNVGELLKIELPARKQLLAPMMAEASIGMAHGPRGLGKTNLMLGIAGAVAFMKPFLRWQPVEGRRVLYVDGELPLTDLQARVAAMIQIITADDADPSYLRFLTPDLHEHGLPDLSTTTGQAALEDHLDDVSLIILDNISTLFRSGVENEAESWGPVQEWALKLRRKGIATWFVHHSGKGGAQRGTSRREDVLDTVIGLRRPGDYREAQGARFEIHFEKHRGFHGADAEPFEAQLATDEDGRQVWLMKDLDDRKTERVAEMLNDGEKVRDIAKALGIGVGTVDRHKKKAASRGLLE